MFGRETRMLLRHYLAQGASKSAVARQLISAFVVSTASSNPWSLACRTWVVPAPASRNSPVTVEMMDRPAVVIGHLFFSPCRILCVPWSVERATIELQRQIPH